MINGLPHSILSALQQGIVVVSPDRIILYANPVFCRLLHPDLKPADLIGSSGHSFLEKFKGIFRLPEEFLDRVEQIYASLKPVQGEVVLLGDGRQLSRDYTPVLEAGAVQAHLWVYQELSSGMASEQLYEQRLLNEFITSLYKKDTEEEILREATQHYIAQLDFSECRIYLVDKTKRLLIERAAWGLNLPAGNVSEDGLEIPLGQGIVGQVAATGLPEIIDDLSSDPRAIFNELMRQSEIAVPIFSRGKVIGIIQCGHPEKSFFQDKHLSTLTTLAAVLGIKITQIRDRQFRQSEVERQRLFFEHILNNIPADIAVFDKEHRYLFVNPQGIRSPEIRSWIINKRDEDYCDYRGRPYSIFEKRRAAFNQAIQTQGEAEWEEELTQSSGEKENHYRKMFPVVNEQGQVDLVIGYGMNVTAIKQAQAALQLAKQEAETNAQAKQTFLTRVSHELRTPMNGIIGLADLLLRSELDKRQTKYMQLLQQSAQSLVSIVNEVLDIEKIGSGKMELHPVVFSLQDRMQTLIDLFQEPARLRSLDLRLSIEKEGASQYRGDINRISQIIGNLLSNAIKFTDRGSVELRVYRQTDETICFQITDTGIGIDPDSIERIFEPFVQAALTGQSPREGTGLGLTICREFAQLMGGSIGVSSVPGTGSSFRLFLPLEPVEELKGITYSGDITIESKNLIGKRVLLVEDLELNRFLVEEMTQTWGIQLDLAENGAIGLQKAQQVHYDLILMDVQMPVLDGVQATRAIRALSNTKQASVPIVALSANAFEQDRLAYLEAGMNDTLPKPFDSERLRRMMEQVFFGQESNPISPASPMQPISSGSRIDLSYLNRVGNQNPEFIQTMLRSFAHSVAECCVELRDSLPTGDRRAIGAVAHKLKFALGVVGVTALNESVAFLENQGKDLNESASAEEYRRVVDQFVQELEGLSAMALALKSGI